MVTQGEKDSDDENIPDLEEEKPEAAGAANGEAKE